MITFNMKTDFGVYATIHRIFALQANPTQRGLTVVMGGYVDENSAQPIVTYSLEFNGDRYPCSADGIVYADIYKEVSAWLDKQEANGAKHAS